MRTKVHRLLVPLPIVLATASIFAAQAIYTTDKAGTIVNQNIYGQNTDVYLSGGPQNQRASGLPDGTYYFQITDPSGKNLLSTDAASCRQLTVMNGQVAGAAPSSGSCKHADGALNSANGTTPVQMAPFSKTPNAGLEYKAWLIPVGAASVSTSDPKVINFKQSSSVTDNFKVRASAVPPTGSCQPSSSLSVLVSGTNVVAYVPKGNWAVTPTTGIGVTNVEGALVVPSLVPTPGTVNSCASNSLSGQTVCTANNTDIYLLSGTSITNTLTSGGSGVIGFSGGFCTNCGVAMDATHNRAVIGLSLGGIPGFQFLTLGSSPATQPAFASMAGGISENPLIDPIRNLLLSAVENGNYEIVSVVPSTSPAFFNNATGAGVLDSSGEDCTTGIALAPAEFSGPSNVFIADLTQATFTAGSPGTWSAPSQVQTLSESILSAGASGIAVAQGTHTGLVTGEFGGDTITAIALPVTSGTGTPAITDWVTCNIGSGFVNGFDPHTVTAYQSPTGGNAIGVLASAGATTLAVVDLTKMLDTTVVPRSGGGHACASGNLPGSVVRFVGVP